MLNIISNQGDANQNYTEIPSHPNQNGNHQEVKKQEMLARMWGNCNSSTLLVGLQISAAAMEISVEIPQKIGNGSTI